MKTIVFLSMMLFFLFGCAKKTPDLRITQEMIDSEYFPYEVSDLVANIFQIDNSPEGVERLKRVPAHWRVVEVIMYYNTEIQNGGHHQYFWNSQG